MMEAGEQAIHRAIGTISRSDPLIKLLQQVRLGKMKPTDAGLQAVTESWLATYQKVVQEGGLTRPLLKRIDPTPRIAMLVDAGIVSWHHPAVGDLQESFQQALARSTD